LTGAGGSPTAKNLFKLF